MRHHQQPHSTQQIKQAFQKEDWDTVTRLCEKALKNNAKNLEATRCLGYALDCKGRVEESLQIYAQGMALWPDDAELLINYGNVLLRNARNGQALPILEKVCALRPDKAICWLKLSECCYPMKLHEKGFMAAQKARQTAVTVPEQSAALTQTSIHLRELGNVQAAIADAEAAIALSPKDVSNHTNRLLFMLADPKADAKALTEAAKEYAAVFEPGLRPLWPDHSAKAGQPWRRLRIGFMSPDLRVHSVMYFMEGVLAQLDRRQFEVHAFYLFPREDYVTQRVKRHVDHFHSIARLSPEAQAKAVLDQGIDILIDLAGHTGHNGLQAMARKPAPLQATWIGFPGTTGLTAIDYLITDAITDPEGVEDLYTEGLLRLPHRLCVYRPMSRNPLWRYQPVYLVRPTPALANGHVTFGSCNNLGKITDTVLSVWAEILRRTPGSHLLIEGSSFDKEDIAEAYRARCEALGIPRDKLELIPLDSKNQYLTYHQIDIALDPFPLNGGTTSMDVLWMGVPLVAMEGESFKSRLTAGILGHLGRHEWLARSAEEYVDIATRLASNVEQLNALRVGLRKEVENSVLMREASFCKDFGRAMRGIWLQWEVRQARPGDIPAQQELIRHWENQMPTEWQQDPVPGVGIAPGQRVTLPQAHALLESALKTAKEVPPETVTQTGQIESKPWYDVTELAETVLCAVPHDAVALTCLAEVEFAHGHQEFGMTYLRHAMESMGIPQS